MWYVSSREIDVHSLHQTRLINELLRNVYPLLCAQAATGLPKAQKDHAERMVRFARDCLVVFGEVTNGLVDELGEDTNQLQVRVGLNSGATTAGVLRGIKGRFQLFG